MAEELTGFPKLWDLEARRRLPETVQEACRKAFQGNVGTDCRRFSATESSAKRRSCISLVAVCSEALLAA